MHLDTRKVPRTPIPCFFAEGTYFQTDFLFPLSFIYIADFTVKLRSQ